MNWRWYRFDEFTAAELYELCAARQSVFVVEQRCPYQDLDGLDAVAQHLIGRVEGGLACALRLLPPGTVYAEHSIGRVLTVPAFRRQGHACSAMQMALARTPAGSPVRISAQAYLQSFYPSFGFRVVGSPYFDAGIEHVEMLRDGAAA